MQITLTGSSSNLQSGKTAQPPGFWDKMSYIEGCTSAYGLASVLNNLALSCAVWRGKNGGKQSCKWEVFLKAQALGNFWAGREGGVAYVLIDVGCHLAGKGGEKKYMLPSRDNKPK